MSNILLEAKGRLIGQRLSPDGDYEAAIAFALPDIIRVDKARLQEIFGLGGEVHVFFAETNALGAAALEKVRAKIQQFRSEQAVAKQAAIDNGQLQIAWLCDDRIARYDQLLQLLDAWIPDADEAVEPPARVDPIE